MNIKAGPWCLQGSIRDAGFSSLSFKFSLITTLSFCFYVIHEIVTFISNILWSNVKKTVDRYCCQKKREGERERERQRKKNIPVFFSWYYSLYLPALCIILFYFCLLFSFIPCFHIPFHFFFSSSLSGCLVIGKFNFLNYKCIISTKLII